MTALTLATNPAALAAYLANRQIATRNDIRSRMLGFHFDRARNSYVVFRGYSTVRIAEFNTFEAAREYVRNGNLNLK